MKNIFLSVLFIVFCICFNNFPQKKPLDLTIFGELLKDFNLPVYQGSDFQLSTEKGKNILLVFPRGYYDQDVWCDICVYEYLDLLSGFQLNKRAEEYTLDLIIILLFADMS